MENAAPKLKQQVEQIYSRLYPNQIVTGCKVAVDDDGLIVRVYSHPRGVVIAPTPYALYRLNPSEDSLTRLTDEEAAPYVIKNYK